MGEICYEVMDLEDLQDKCLSDKLDQYWDNGMSTMRERTKNFKLFSRLSHNQSLYQGVDKGKPWSEGSTQAIKRKLRAQTIQRVPDGEIQTQYDKNSVEQVELEYDRDIKEADLDIRWSLPGEKVILRLDSQKAYRVFENLIVNITKYAMPHTRVYVEMTEREEGVHISMKNVSACELTFDTEEITDRFVRGDSSRNTEGSGLGLAIAKSFVELQHGTLKISTEADLFKADIDLPKMEMPEEARKEQEELEAMRWQQEEAFGSCDEPDAEDNQVEKEEDQLVIAEKEETQHREN